MFIEYLKDLTFKVLLFCSRQFEVLLLLLSLFLIVFLLHDGGHCCHYIALCLGLWLPGRSLLFVRLIVSVCDYDRAFWWIDSVKLFVWGCGPCLWSNFILITLIHFIKDSRALYLPWVRASTAQDASNIQSTLNFLRGQVLVQDLQILLRLKVRLSLAILISHSHIRTLLPRWTYSEALELVIDFCNAPTSLVLRALFLFIVIQLRCWLCVALRRFGVCGLAPGITRRAELELNDLLFLLDRTLWLLDLDLLDFGGFLLFACKLFCVSAVALFSSHYKISL